jgi:hypothetical protein
MARTIPGDGYPRDMYLRNAPHYQRRQRWLAQHPALAVLVMGVPFGAVMALVYGAFGLIGGVFFGCFSAYAFRRAVTLGEAASP